MKVTLLENMGCSSCAQNRILTFLGLWPSVRRRASSWCSWAEAPGAASEMGSWVGWGALIAPEEPLEAFSSRQPTPVTFQYRHKRHQHLEGPQGRSVQSLLVPLGGTPPAEKVADPAVAP